MCFMVCTKKTGKIDFLTFHGSGCKKEKNASLIMWILKIWITTEKIKLTGWGSKREKMLQPKKVIFWEKGTKSKKNIFT